MIENFNPSRNIKEHVWSAESSPPFEVLPNELILLTLSWLSDTQVLGIQRVNRIWRFLANSKVLWKKLIKRDFSKYLANTVLPTMGHDGYLLAHNINIKKFKVNQSHCLYKKWPEGHALKSLPNKKQYVAVDTNGNVNLMDEETKTIISSKAINIREDHAINCSADGSLLAVIDTKIDRDFCSMYIENEEKDEVPPRAFLWNLKTQEMLELKGGGDASKPAPYLNSENCVAISSNQKLIAAIFRNQVLSMWDIQGNHLLNMDLPTMQTNYVDFIFKDTHIFFQGFESNIDSRYCVELYDWTFDKILPFLARGS